ncbi:MAG: LysR substrate-binding domain-containing protein [Emcibacteraceae bacterium]|nr:LysR substrate-binding domain-containing protein [Emcibacteraceae bacterium]
MRRNLPPFTALKAFEAAAKHNSFKTAAEDVSLSPSAISHQIRLLEDYLGFQLFIRDKGFVRLSERGVEYYSSIQTIFDDLEQTTQDFRIHQNKTNIVINLFHSFLSSWLYEKLPDFQKKHPDIELSFISSDNPPEYDKFEFDVAIYFGQKPLSGVKSIHLLDDCMTMVASPEMAASLPKTDDIFDLEHVPFLHCTCETKEWEIWFNSFGQPCPKSEYQLNTNDRSMVLKGAAQNMGIAIGRQPFMDKHLKNGTLVVPYDKYIDTGYKYYFTYPKSLEQNENIIHFEKWLVEQCQHLTAPSSPTESIPS